MEGAFALVTETAPETQVTTPVTEQTTSAPTGDAANQTTDAAASSAQDEADASVKAFLDKSKEGKGEGSKEAVDGDAGKADDVDPLIKDAQEKAAKATEERVARETAERIEREDRDRKAAERETQLKAAFEKRYGERMANAGPNLEQKLLNLGVREDIAKQLAKETSDDFNSHHADGLQLYEPEAKSRADADLTGRINDTLRDVLGNDATKFFGAGDDEKRYDLKGHYEALKSIWTENMISKSDAEAEQALALAKYHRELQTSGRLKGSNSTTSTNGSSSGSGANYSTKTEARNLHATGQLSNADMRRINADPSIPES